MFLLDAIAILLMSLPNPSIQYHSHSSCSVLFSVAFAPDLSSLGIEYLTFNNRPDIVECIEPIDHPLIDFLRDNANYSYRIN